MSEVSTETSGHVYTTNAPKGAELFDERFPGWAGKIDREKFSIRSMLYCAAAQVAGNGYYWDGLRELFPAAIDQAERYEQARKYGFAIDVPYSEIYDPHRYDEFAVMWDTLQADWEHLIDARRDTGSA